MSRFLSILLSALFIAAPAWTQPAVFSPEKALGELKTTAENIDLGKIKALPVQQNGRLKPLDTLAREALLFLNGSYSRFGLDPVQVYLSLPLNEASQFVEIVEVRDTKLRQELGYLKEKRFYSLAELQSSTLGTLSDPILKKQQENSKSLSTYEKSILEVLSQGSLLQEIISGQHIMGAADFSFLNNTHGTNNSPGGAPNIQDAIKAYLGSLSQDPSAQQQAASTLISAVRAQEIPQIFKHYMDTMELEVFYNRAKLFFWSSILSIIIGICFFTPLFREKVSKKTTVLLFFIPMFILMVGLCLRVYITEFAPVTNMYSTMLWVALGVMVFSLLLFYLYQNYAVPGLSLIVSGLILMLAQQIPLILSPDLDPIVAVLRSNFWLSTHVTTITISYAAFTIAMAIGNVALVRLWFYKDNEKFFAEYSRYAYRMIQLGCFLLTIGIILGGIWADYSWGRFWGWDPKETWALIADVGFLAILHGRIAGWIKPFSLLALSPVAYLLVIMAWYGVNFVLAAGLHSYGFSSGGAMAMAIFVGAQVLLLAAGFWKLRTVKLSS